MSLKYDIHLAAIQISPATVAKLAELGFVRDEFANNTRCEASEYHATFRGARHLPDDELWESICEVLRTDARFSGCLEEESIAAEHCFNLTGEGSELPAALPHVRLTRVPADEHKACDLHIGINLDHSAACAVQHLENLQTASFDKPTANGVHRVFTITCQTTEDGERLLEELYKNLSRVPGLRGRMKLELTTRYFRHPADAATLPLTPSDAVAEWLYDLLGTRATRESGRLTQITPDGNLLNQDAILATNCKEVSYDGGLKEFARDE